MALRDISLNAKNPHKKRKLDKLCDSADLKNSEKSQPCDINMDTKDTSLLPSNSNQAARLEDSIILLDDEPETSDQSKPGDTAEVCVPATESKSDVPKQSNNDEDDEDIAIMYTKPSETVTYPHPRADCTSHLFHKTDNATLGPIGRNTNYCYNCFCYICDTRASECQEWNNSSGAHCNAHRKADVWKCRRNSRKSALILRLTLEETTQEVRDAASRAQELAFEVTKEYIQYRNTPNDMKLNFDKVKSVFMNAVGEAGHAFEAGHATMSLVILDEMIRLLCLEKPPPPERLAPDDRLRPYGSSGFHGRREIMKAMDEILIDIFLEDKIAISLRRTVLINIKIHLSKNLDGWRMEDYISLTMRHWDDPLLSPVLHGQNITGKRGGDILKENIVVAKKRLKILEEKGRWQHAARYVKITQFTGTQNTQSAWIDIEIREQLPRFLIFAGKMDEALARLTTETVVQTSQNKYKCVKSSPLSRFSPHNLLVVFKLFSGETRIEPPYPGGLRKILATTQMFRLCLKSLVENQNTWTSLELIEWIIKMFLSGKLCEVESNIYKSYVTMSEMLIASVRTHQPLGVSEDIQPMVWMLSVVKILADAIAKDIVALPMNAQNVVTLFIPVFQKNPWLLCHFLSSASLQNKLETPALYTLLIDVYIRNHGIQRLPDQVIERVIARLTVKQVVNFLEAILLHASKPSEEIQLNVVPGFVRMKVYAYALAIAKKRSSAPHIAGSESENCETVRLIKLISSLRIPYIVQDKHLLMYLALRTFGISPSINSLEALQSLCGSAEWPSYRQSCIQALNNSVIEIPGRPPKQQTVSGSELLELYFKLDAYDQVYKLLESSKCRIDSRIGTAGKSLFVFNMVKKENLLKLTSLLESCGPVNVRIVLKTSRQWLVNELYGPILLRHVPISGSMFSLLDLVGRLESSFLVGVLHDAIQQLQKKICDISVSSDQRSSIVAWLKNIQGVLQRCNRLQDFVNLVDIMKNGCLRRKVSLRKDLCTHFDQLTQSLSRSGFVSRASSSQVSSGDALQTANPDAQCLPMFPSKEIPRENLGKLPSIYSTQPKEPQQPSLQLPLSTAESRITPHQGAIQGQNFQHLLKTTNPQAPNINTDQYTKNTSVSSESRSTPSTMSFTQTSHVSSSPVVLQANQHVMLSNQLQNVPSAASSLQQSSQDTRLNLLPNTKTTLPQNIQNASMIYVQSPLSVGSQQPPNQPQPFQAPLIMANNQLNAHTNPVSVQVSVRPTNQQVPITVQRVNVPVQLVTQNQQPQKQPETHIFQRPLIALNQRHAVPVSVSLQIQRPMAGASQPSHASLQVQHPVRASNQQVQNQIASTVVVNQPVVISQQQLQQQIVSSMSATQQQRPVAGIQHSSTTVAPHAQHGVSPAVIQSQQQKPSSSGIHQTTSSLSQQQGLSSVSPAVIQSQQLKPSSSGIHQTPSSLSQQQGVSAAGIPPSPKTILQQQTMFAAGASSCQTSVTQMQKTSVGINQARTDSQQQNLFSKLMHHPVSPQQQHLSSFTTVEHANNPIRVSTIRAELSGTLPQTQNITDAGSTQVQAPTRQIQPNVIGKGATVTTLDWLNRIVESNFAHQKTPALDTPPEPNSSTQGNPNPGSKHHHYQTQLQSAPNLQRNPKASTSLHSNSQSKPADSKTSQKKRKHKDEESEASPHKSKSRKVNKTDSKTHSAGMFYQKGVSTSKPSNKDTASRQTNSTHRVENFMRSVLSIPASYPLDKYPVVALRRLSPKTLRKYKVKEPFV